MPEFTYTVTRTRVVTERLVLEDSPKALIGKFEADNEVDARLMVKGMLKLRQYHKLLWQEMNDVVSGHNVEIIDISSQ